MKSRETLIRLKKFQVDEKRRKVAQIEAMIAEFDRIAGDHEREIKGQLDRRGVSKYGLITVEIKLYDWKSWHGLQLADYEYMAEGCPEDLDSTDRRWVITLYPDGTYGQKKFDDPNDLRIFLAAAKYGLDSEAVVAWLNTHRR